MARGTHASYLHATITAVLALGPAVSTTWTGSAPPEGNQPGQVAVFGGSARR